MSDLDSLLVGSSEEMKKLRKNLSQVAQAWPGLNVMLIGASGTGKDVAAKAIHDGSSLAEKTYLALNCSSLNEQLAESILFGSKKGAFTGASSDSKGLLGEIDPDPATLYKNKQEFAGTLFLDELHDLPPGAQGLLLRFLESGEYRRLGDSKLRYAKVRIIAALQPGEKMRSRLRDDLYNRLAEVEIRLPELNNRREDIPPIAQNLLERLTKELPTPTCFFHGKSIMLDQDRIGQVMKNSKFFDELKNHNWSRGNVRDLRSTMRKAALLNDFSLPDPGTANNLDALQPASDSVQIILPADPDKLLKANDVKTEYVKMVEAKLKKTRTPPQMIREILGITDNRTLKKILGE